MTLAELDTLYAAAAAALESQDYVTAITKAQQARLRLATTPNTARAAGGGSTSIAWPNLAAIDSFIADCRRAQQTSQAASGGPFQQTRIRYVRG